MPKVSVGSENSCLEQYLSEVHKYPILDPVQERELTRRWREKRDPEAGQLLVTSNLRFVVKIAAEYKYQGFQLIDLIQEGNVGLLQAISRYEPDRDVRLLTYAVWWIRSSILTYILRTWSLVRIGTTRSQRKLFFALRKTKHQLRGLEGKEPDRETLARTLETDVESIDEMETMLSARDVSIYTPIRDSGRLLLIDRLSDEQPCPEEWVCTGEVTLKVRAALTRAMAVLDPRERLIIERRHLSDSDDKVTLRELGQEFGVTRERVRQLENRAKRKLRAKLDSLLPGDIPNDFIPGSWKGRGAGVGK